MGSRDFWQLQLSSSERKRTLETLGSGEQNRTPEMYTNVDLGVCTPRPPVTFQVTQLAIETRPDSTRTRARLDP